MEDPRPAPPGFFGKLPARGDFLSRRLPPGIAASWEEWLATLTTAAREAAGPEWPDAWLTAPLWHFSLGSALAPPHGAAGVLVASADRVGRLFPFTVVGACDPRQPQDEAVLGRWTAAVEGFVLDALGDGFDPAALEALLADLGPPPPVTGPGAPPGALPLPDGPSDGRSDGDLPEEQAADGVSDILDDPPEPQPASPDLPENLDSDLASILGDHPAGSEARAPEADAMPAPQQGRDRPGPGQSVWWCRGSDRVAPVQLRCDGLPDPATGAAMILGGAELAPR